MFVRLNVGQFFLIILRSILVASVLQDTVHSYYAARCKMFVFSLNSGYPNSALKDLYESSHWNSLNF